MAFEHINSDESEGFFNDFIEDQLENIIEDMVNDGGLENRAGRGSDVIIEMDGLESPEFVYDTPGQGGKGSGTGKPGRKKGRLRYALPFRRVMELLGRKLGLPNLSKTGEGKIKSVSIKWNTFAPVGVVLDKKRTFKRALKSSIALGDYSPDNDKYDILIRRKNKRFKQFEEIEIPRYRAVVFYIGDISYSTSGKRLEQEKKMVNFIQNWLDFNYGVKNVEHRYFVHEAQAYEVHEDDFYRVTNSGGTMAYGAFDLVSNIAVTEYDPLSTNYYMFYFGDGELFDDDAQRITEVLKTNMKPYFNRIGCVEIYPSTFSSLAKSLGRSFSHDKIIKMSEYRDQTKITDIIKELFSE